jgi:hypothetical protein
MQNERNEVPVLATSWVPEVMVSGETKFIPNGMRFATKAECDANLEHLMMRWFAVTETRATPSNDPVNYRWDAAAGRAVAVEQVPA